MKNEVGPKKKIKRIKEKREKVVGPDGLCLDPENILKGNNKRKKKGAWALLLFGPGLDAVWA